METLAYQVSSTDISAKWAIDVRYEATVDAADRRASFGSRPSHRAARTKLVASRFTSHSNGPGRVSSKSVMSKTSARSGVAKPPKFIRWQSPQHCTVSPADGVPFRSYACRIAEPRKKANADSAIRVNRTGRRLSRR